MGGDALGGQNRPYPESANERPRADLGELLHSDDGVGEPGLCRRHNVEILNLMTLSFEIFYLLSNGFYMVNKGRTIFVFLLIVCVFKIDFL